MYYENMCDESPTVKLYPLNTKCSQSQGKIQNLLLFLISTLNIKLSSYTAYNKGDYFRSLPDGVEPRYVSPEELASMDEEEQKLKLEDHNSKRNRTQTFRDNDRVERLILKEQQLEACQEMQVCFSAWWLIL